MPRRMKLVILLVMIWAAIFVASYFMSTGIEGPRNIDTGLRRLDVLVRYQLIAIVVAAVSAVTGIVWRREAKRIMIVGLVPLLVTILLIAAIVVGTMIFRNRPAPQEAYQPPKPTAPAVDLIAPAQN